MINKASITNRDAHEAVHGAITELMMRFPLAGLSCLGEAVVIEECSHADSLNTDGRSIRYSPHWIMQSTHRGRIFDLLHEWLHIFFNHVLRCQDRNPEVWNMACDIIVVAEACRVLSTPNDTWEPPTDGVIPPPWSVGLTTEEIYDKLVSNPQSKPQPKRPKPEGTDTPSIQDSSDLNYAGAKALEANPEKEDEFYRKFSSELAQANLVMQQISNKSSEDLYGPVIGSRLNQVLRGKIPWSRLLKGDMLKALGDEFTSYSPPKMRYYPEIILPTLKSRQEKTLLIAIDDSASVGERLHREFVANVMPAANRAEWTVVVTFDQIIRETIRTRKPKDIMKQAKFLSGIHSCTDVRPVFELAKTVKPSAIAILTDGFLSIPDKPVPNTLWCIPTNGKSQPWGKNYVMDITW